ncbi:unnamed protein product [Mytilus coruscus]|uniref:Uncharacterized protein n=1 Tax=Mytilus coruscus TaxID=42192 RepID=A0A6J8CVA1_MYTCO|nr:unnamed protein product [Mytilus coruscus]
MLRRVRRMCHPSPRKNRLVVQEMAATLWRNTENSASTSGFFHRITVDLEIVDFFDPNKKTMISLDDRMFTSAKNSRINDLFREGSHHRNLSVVVLNQNLFFGQDPTQRRNCHYLVLFNNPIDRQHVKTIGRQMYPSRSDFFLRKFEEATSRSYGILLVDLKPGTTELS